MGTALRACCRSKLRRFCGARMPTVDDLLPELTNLQVASVLVGRCCSSGPASGLGSLVPRRPIAPLAPPEEPACRESTSCAPVPQSRSHHARLRRRNLALPFALHLASDCVRIEGIVCGGVFEDRSLPTETPLRSHNEHSWHGVPRGRRVAHVLPTGRKDPVRVAIGGTRAAMTVRPSWYGQAACRPDPVTSGATAAGSSLRLSRGLPSGKRGCRSAG